jgi:hypothetical protein
MAPKPQTLAEYAARTAAMDALKAGVIELMTRLGDVAEEVVIVGGFAPVLLFPDAAVPPIGTLDVDLGLSLGLLKEKRYQGLEDRLTAAGFKPDMNNKGNPSPQRWTCDSPTGNVVVDLLMPLFSDGVRPGRPQFLTPRLAAFAIPGLELAHLDVEQRTLTGYALGGGWAEQNVRVCGPGALVILKALAFDNRGEKKDAHDLIYVLESAGLDDVVRRIKTFPQSSHLNQAFEALASKFLRADGVGPVRVAQFRSGATAESIQAEAAARVRELLRQLGRL